MITIGRSTLINVIQIEGFEEKQIKDMQHCFNTYYNNQNKRWSLFGDIGRFSMSDYQNCSSICYNILEKRKIPLQAS